MNAVTVNTAIIINDTDASKYVAPKVYTSAGTPRRVTPEVWLQKKYLRNIQWYNTSSSRLDNYLKAISFIALDMMRSHLEVIKSIFGKFLSKI